MMKAPNACLSSYRIQSVLENFKKYLLEKYLDWSVLAASCKGLERGFKAVGCEREGQG